MSRVHGTKNHARAWRPPGDGDCRPGSFLDVEDWHEAQRRIEAYQRWASVAGELDLVSALLDAAMTSIFTREDPVAWADARRAEYANREEFNRERRAADLQWLFESGGPLGARGCCSALLEAGWTKTRRGWPTTHWTLCSVARAGLSMGLFLRDARPGRHQTDATRRKIAVARRRACRTPEGHAQILRALAARHDRTVGRPPPKPATRSTQESAHVH